MEKLHNDPGLPPPRLSPGELQLTQQAVAAQAGLLDQRFETRQIAENLARMRTVYGERKLEDAHQVENYRMWIKAISKVAYPAHVLDAAFVEHVRVSNFFPKPAEIIAHADRLLWEERVKLGRLQIAALPPAAREAPRPRLTPADIEYRRAQVVRWKQEYGYQGAVS